MHIESKKNYIIIANYIFWGILWILFSDTLIYRAFNNSPLFYTLSTYKGTIFILLSSILLFNMMKNNTREYGENKKIIADKDLKLQELQKNFREKVQKNIIQSFIRTLEFYDNYTKEHCEQVAYYCTKVGKALNIKDMELEDLYWAGIMHDIGKLTIPVEILNKKEKLSVSEYELIKEHPRKGYEIVSECKSLENISKYILSHHERWDGEGYPEGLKGDEIPLLSQIIAVADSWHAMTSDRPYKRALSIEEGIEELIRNRGTQFSPKVVDIFIDNEIYLTTATLLPQREIINRNDKKLKLI
ncbi:HD-GYP domain-containing protein [uncultured Ilyobacter sp.]|uniref:HD-GYP domain-containing protein n=1 Tax=uncultured Ilyobacter sp. TaxID=544433 RepID=UPI002AA658AF|nr:HD-GYP domain-containing protein [uncultured Ilyobacter sp.]